MAVSLTSPNLTGGARSSVTDEQGIYRFTDSRPASTRSSWNWPASTLNIEGVQVSGGATMTINGKLPVASLEESITVTSQAPTIDLESSKVAVNWDQQKLDDLPYSRSTPELGVARAGTLPRHHLRRRRFAIRQ